MRALLGLFAVGCSGGGALPHGASSADCGTCHAAQAAGLNASSHARGTSSPVFAALLPRVEAAWGNAARERCVGCHAPAHGVDHAVSCVSCHAAIGNREERNGALVVDLDAPLASASARLTNDAHAVAPRGLLTSASLCGTCHEVHGPGLFDERTLTEFRESGADDSCVSCHDSTDHRFAGVDPPWGLEGDERARAEDSTHALWSKALGLELVAQRDAVVVTLENPGRHAVPTGVTMLRDVWIDLEFTGQQTRTAPRVIDLRARMTANGAPVALLTDATAVEEGALKPGQTRSVRVQWPSGATSARAVLRTRGVRDDVLEALSLQALTPQVRTFVALERVVARPP